jgi:hypothetical protein
LRASAGASAGSSCSIFLLVLLLGIGATTLVWPRLLAYQPALAATGIDPAGLGLSGRLAACITLALMALPLLAAVREALLLCRLVSGGQVFPAEVPRHLRRMGLALVVSAVLQPAGGALLSLTVSIFLGGQRHIAIPLSADYVGVAVIGAVLIAVAAAAREAVRLADENAHFV